MVKHRQQSAQCPHGYSHVFLLFSVLVALAGQAGAGEFTFDDQTITVPDGFLVERIAAAPLTSRPITGAFDEQGRLYVAESSGSNDPVKEQLEEKPHSILRLEDVDGDGFFDRRTVYADRMMFPEGTLWLDGSLYVTAPPEIWKLTDTDDDGVADLREVWYNPGTLTGCANDLHGPYLGLDGWIYWCKGAFARQEHTLIGGETFHTRASHIFRRHPRGGGVDVVMTGGMDNPVEVAFLPSGERFFSATFLQHPGGGIRDGIVHAIYGGTYGKLHDVIDEHPRTGDILPTLSQLGPAAACALMRYESSAFGEAYRDNLFSSSFNLAKITRHRLRPSGATYAAIDEDFLVSNNADFHPTHIIEDADGSLIVIDTGGWYKLCCPTSQLHKPDVFGAIYRVRKADAPRLEDPRGLAFPWQDVTAQTLVRRLGDKRGFVRRRAINTLGHLGASAVPALRRCLRESANAEARVAAVWALTRIEVEDARAAVVSALTDDSATVRQAAIHSVALWRDSGAVDALRRLLRHDSAHHRRAAAEALGRIGDSSATVDLLAAAAEPVDRILDHSLIYALIELNDANETRSGLNSTSPHVRRAALVALDQMSGATLSADRVVPLLSAPEPVLRDTANWLVSRHDDWGAALADYFAARLSHEQYTPNERRTMARQMAGVVGDAAVQAVIGEGLAAEEESIREACLHALQATRLKTLPATWIDPMMRVLETSGSLLGAALSAARVLPLDAEESEPLRRRLLRIAKDGRHSSRIRLEALAALPADRVEVDDELFAFLTDALRLDHPVAIRTSATERLASLDLNEQQLLQLTAPIERAGPLEVNRLLSAFNEQKDERLGRKLLASLKKADAFRSLRRETIEPVLAAFPEDVQTAAHELYTLLNEDAAEQAAHIDRLLADMKEGDIRRGQALFNSEATACKTCHAIGYLGGDIGPDLTTIGQIRNERDLLEAILYPSLSFVRSYEPIRVETVNNEFYSGLLKQETEEEIVLTTGINAEARIQRDEITEMAPGGVSVMPDGLLEQLTAQQIADLLAFLKNTRWR